MKAMIIVGVVLAVLGVVGLFFGGFPVSADKDTIKLGPIEATVREEKHFPLPPVVSMAALAGGIVLVILGTRK
jgi:hypothetical protein